MGDANLSDTDTGDCFWGGRATVDYAVSLIIALIGIGDEACEISDLRTYHQWFAEDCCGDRSRWNAKYRQRHRCNLIMSESHFDPSGETEITHQRHNRQKICGNNCEISLGEILWCWKRSGNCIRASQLPLKNNGHGKMIPKKK